jgi:hypothetical protein
MADLLLMLLAYPQEQLPSWRQDAFAQQVARELLTSSAIPSFFTQPRTSA